MPDNTGGTKFDQGKLRTDLLPIVAIEEITKVLAFGCKKYDDWNWSKGIAYSRLLGATLRHIFAWAKGQDKDPESGISHLAHAGCCIFFLLYFEKYRSDLDDRHKDPRPVAVTIVGDSINDCEGASKNGI